MKIKNKIMKIDIQEVEGVLLQNKVDQAKVQAVIKDLNEIIEELKNDKDITPKQKYEYVIILNDKDGCLKGKEIAGWVVQQEENADAGLILSKLKDAAKTQNEAAKRKKNMITDLTALFESLKSKFTKEKKIKIKTKDLTRVIVTTGNF